MEPFGLRDIYVQARHGSVEWLVRHRRILGEIETLRKEYGLAQVRVLDFGGGTGALATVADGLGLPGYAFEVVDTDADALASCPVPSRLLDPSGGLPYPDNTFDVVASSDVFEHIPRDERGRWAAECRRVARLATAHTFPAEGGDWAGAAADARFDAWYVSLFGRSERYTAEHLELGLPRREELDVLFPRARVEGLLNVDVWGRIVRRQFTARTPMGRLASGLWYLLRGRRLDDRPPWKSALVVERLDTTR